MKTMFKVPLLSIRIDVMTRFIHVALAVLAAALVAIPLGKASETPPVPLAANGRSGADAFLRWAAGALQVVSAEPADGKGLGVGPLLNMIGPAQWVAFSEATHSDGEALRFRNALFLALARERGYRALAMESGLSEGTHLHEYVRGGSEPIDLAVAQGFSWGFDGYLSNRQLLSDLRAYNASNPDSPVSLYGFDVPGSPGNAGVARGANTALEESLAYLRLVDEAEYEAMRHRVANFMGLGSPEAFARYKTFASADRDRLTGAIADLVGLFERRETAYVKASSPEAFSWGLRHAIGARQIDSMLRLLSPETGMINLVEHHAYRDRAMADNLAWIRDREGPEARIMIFAARFHVAGAPVLASWRGTGSPWESSVTLGSHLRARYGDRVVLIGTILGRSAACGVPRRTAAMDFDSLLSKLDTPSFVLDLRQAPAAARAWLNHVRLLRVLDYGAVAVNLAQAFDILYYHQIGPPDCQP